MRNCLLVISKNEGMNPISIAHQAIESDIIDKVIISDGSNPSIFKGLKQNETNKIQVIHEKKYVDTYEKGKGIGMINGAVAALKQDFDNIAFMDGDICCKNVDRWFKYMFEPLNQDEVDIVRVSFLRNPTDGQITRHIIKPLIAMFFPNSWDIDQPIGGELALKKNVLNDIFLKGIKPPMGWGIDIFITLKSLIYGYRMGDIYLGKKLHNNKDLSVLKNMFYECFQQSARLIHYFYSLPVRKKIKPIIKISSPYEKNIVFNNKYMDVEKEIKKSINTFRFLKEINLPNDKYFMRFKNIINNSEFYEYSKQINKDIWVEHLYWIVKKYSPYLMDQYFYRWKIRALSFCLNEIQNLKQAENQTAVQSKTSVDFISKIGERRKIDNTSESPYFFSY